MEYVSYSHRHASTLFEQEEPYRTLWGELHEVISGISDDDLIDCFERFSVGSKSISSTINMLLRERLVAKDWCAESPIFTEMPYTDDRETKWRLDFAKGELAVEVAFNHGEATSWNLLKPVLAGELNHVRKAIQTSAGVVITATEAMRLAGGFDSAVGTYEKFLLYLNPLRNQLTIPMLLIGLLPPATFRIAHRRLGNRKIGSVHHESGANGQL